MAQFGLSEEVLEAISDIFTTYEKITRVWIFGSRAMGRHKQGSDIDLALEGEALNFDDLLVIRLKLENLMLPYRFDLVNLAELTKNDTLREHIDRVGQVIFARNPSLETEH